MTDVRLQMRPYPLGARRCTDGIEVSFVSRTDNCGVILYHRETGKRLKKIPFLPEERFGNVHYKWLPDVDASQISYQFYEEDKVVADPYAQVFLDKTVYGHQREEKDLKAGLLQDNFDWDGDRNPCIPYENCICYGMHVRGFTKHSSSGVTHRGTFQGVIEKLSYLKELGITTVELQPAYEFLEMPADIELKKQIPSDFTGEGYSEQQSGCNQEEVSTIPRLNYWGYKKGYYYAPKKGYAAGEDPSVEFKEMIKAFHRNQMEVIMQFYFPPEVPHQEIPEILRFWAWEYHVDGFHLIGENLPVSLLAGDDALVNTKLWYFDFQTEAVYGQDIEPIYRNLAQYKDDFMYDMRRYLKGDSNMLNSVLYHMRKNPLQKGCLNYFTNYYGFTLMDLVCYDERHNESNGEQNQDGISCNFSWNCGTEGPSRKGKVVKLRKKQMKNALSMLFLSQGTPLIFMGDEFGNSQKGNNNPYCQDNEIAWLNWRDLEKNQDLYEFTASLIQLRQTHPILHQKKEMRIMDYIACGYPDLSYHGEAAWRPSFDYYSHQLGIMYCGKYAKNSKDEEDDFFYVAMNMHWEPHIFALPRLPKGLSWKLYLQTEESKTLENRNEDTTKSAVIAKVSNMEQQGNLTSQGIAAHKESKPYQGTELEEKYQTCNVASRSVSVFISRPEGNKKQKTGKR